MVGFKEVLCRSKVTNGLNLQIQGSLTGRYRLTTLTWQFPVLQYVSDRVEPRVYMFMTSRVNIYSD